MAWEARPILVSGTTAYRKGEFLYQDFLYDDTGARLAFDPNDPRTAGNLCGGAKATPFGTRCTSGVKRAGRGDGPARFNRRWTFDRAIRTSLPMGKRNRRSGGFAR